MTAIRAGICLAVSFSVLAFGGVETWSESVLEITAAGLFLLWGLFIGSRRGVEIHWSPVFAPMLAFGGIVLLQWLLGLSVYPYLTKVELLKLAAYFLLSFLAMQCFRAPEQARLFVWFLLLLGFGVALFGIIQHFTFNGKLYWVREVRQGGFPFGPYVNRNHFAGLMELIVPSGLAVLLQRAVRRDQLPLVGLFTSVAIAALLLAASRGGIVAFLFQVALLGLLLRARPAGPRRLVPALAVLLLAGGLAAWLGVGPALERFTRVGAGEISRDRRVVMLNDSWRIFLDHPATGTGLGTLENVYPRYESLYDGKVVNHAHNDYVELLAETGVAGGLCGVVFLVLLFRSALKPLGAEPEPLGVAVKGGALVGCCGLLLHGLVDFNLHIPANALLFYLLASLAGAPAQPARVSTPGMAR